MTKKISLPIAITAVLLASAIAFTCAFLISNAVTNSRLKDLSEKQAMYGNLSDVDNFVREKYTGEIDEDKLSSDLCKAYAESLGEGVLYITKDEYDESKYPKDEGYVQTKLANGDVIVISPKVTQE